ncbi:hypothetical protein HDU86_004905 [Geranomyces michiganensis]|nr:hypothetical protein HDU86_004905 [Geranomyces michiganensis]
MCYCQSLSIPEAALYQADCLWGSDVNKNLRDALRRKRHACDNADYAFIAFDYALHKPKAGGGDYMFMASEEVCKDLKDKVYSSPVHDDTNCKVSFPVSPFNTRAEANKAIEAIEDCHCNVLDEECALPRIMRLGAEFLSDEATCDRMNNAIAKNQVDANRRISEINHCYCITYTSDALTTALHSKFSEVTDRIARNVVGLSIPCITKDQRTIARAMNVIVSSPNGKPWEYVDNPDSPGPANPPVATATAPADPPANPPVATATAPADPPANPPVATATAPADPPANPPVATASAPADPPANPVPTVIATHAGSTAGTTSKTTITDKGGRTSKTVGGTVATTSTTATADPTSTDAPAQPPVYPKPTHGVPEHPTYPGPKSSSSVHQPAYPKPTHGVPEHPAYPGSKPAHPTAENKAPKDHPKHPDAPPPASEETVPAHANVPIGGGGGGDDVSNPVQTAAPVGAVAVPIKKKKCNHRRVVRA